MEQTEWDNDYGPIVNGKVYPMWGQFVMKKNEWIGGTMVEKDSILIREREAIIEDVSLEPNGRDSASLCFKGDKFTFKADIRTLGVGPDQPKEGLRIHASFGSSITITKRVLH